MAKIRRHSFLVEGSGRFPIDMLRYDSAWPSTEEDSARIDKASSPPWRGATRIIIETDNPNAPTVGRWESFGWSAR